MGVLDIRHGFGDSLLVKMEELTPRRAQPLGDTCAAEGSFSWVLQPRRLGQANLYVCLKAHGGELAFRP